MKGKNMSDEVTNEDIEGFADKLAAFSQTLSASEQALLSDMVSMAANVDPDEVVGFADFGIRQMVVGLPFGGFSTGGFSPPILRSQELQPEPKWNN
jgi:hypothetical protein